jgi:hypothetical protein
MKPPAAPQGAWRAWWTVESLWRQQRRLKFVSLFNGLRVTWAARVAAWRQRRAEAASAGAADFAAGATVAAASSGTYDAELDDPVVRAKVSEVGFTGLGLLVATALIQSRTSSRMSVDLLQQ